MILDRTIKFRVWDKQTNVFLRSYKNEGLLFSYVDMTDEEMDEYGCHNITSMIQSKNVIVQQYTSLIDKYAREIYEGDIVKSDTKNLAYTLNPNLTIYEGASIKFFNGAFKICEYYKGSSDLWSLTGMCHCCPCGLEIIGNIFETPELASMQTLSHNKTT